MNLSRNIYIYVEALFLILYSVVTWYGKQLNYNRHIMPVITYHSSRYHRFLYRCWRFRWHSWWCSCSGSGSRTTSGSSSGGGAFGGQYRRRGGRRGLNWYWRSSVVGGNIDKIVIQKMIIFQQWDNYKVCSTFFFRTLASSSIVQHTVDSLNHQ